MKISILNRAAAAARKAAENAAQNRPGTTVTRVAVRSDHGASTDFDICSREFYEEGCSESEFICQAIAILDDGRLSSEIEQ